MENVGNAIGAHVIPRAGHAVRRRPRLIRIFRRGRVDCHAAESSRFETVLYVIDQVRRGVDGRKGPAFIEHTIADGRDSVRNRDAGYAVLPGERAIADCRHGCATDCLGYCDFGSALTNWIPFENRGRAGLLVLRIYKAKCRIRHIAPLEDLQTARVNAVPFQQLDDMASGVAVVVVNGRQPRPPGKRVLAEGYNRHTAYRGGHIQDTSGGRDRTEAVVVHFNAVDAVAADNAVVPREAHAVIVNPDRRHRLDECDCVHERGFMTACEQHRLDFVGAPAPYVQSLEAGVPE